MELRNLQARLTPRGPWQAMDLGTRMLRAWWRPLLLTWLVFTAVPFVVIFAWLGAEHFYASVFVFWWLKPLWEQPLLAFCSRALFGEYPGPFTLVREFPRYGFQDLLSLLTIRRLSPSRSFNLPVFQLEKSRGDARNRRLAMLHRPPSNRSGMLTIVLLHVEQGLTLGMLLLLYFLAPWQFNLEVSAWLMQQEATHQWLQAVSWYLVLSLIEPLYVACGFALYLNRRSWLEGWDLELGLRHIGERRRQTGAGMAAALMLSLPLLAGQPAEAAKRPTRNPQEAALEIVAGPDFMPLERRIGWRQRDWVNTGENNWLERIPKDWLSEQEPGEPQEPNLWPARIFQGALWGLVTALVLWTLWHYRHWLPRFERRRRPNAPATHVAGLDIRPESLPDDIGAAVREQLGTGDARAALALLYRASLSRLVHAHALPVQPGTTEHECLILLRQRRPEERLLAFMGKLTRLWTATAWAHQPAGTGDVEACLDDWQAIFVSEDPDA